MRRIGEVTAHEVKATALDWVFAPTLAVARDDRWGRAYESYSEDRNPSDSRSNFARPARGTDSDNFLGKRVVATANILSAMAARNMVLIRATPLAALATSKKSTPIPIAPPLRIRENGDGLFLQRQWRENARLENLDPRSVPKWALTALL